jgi:hypothetical protein
VQVSGRWEAGTNAGGVAACAAFNVMVERGVAVADLGSRWPAVLMTAAVVAVVVGSVVASCGTSGRRSVAPTVVTTVPTSTSTPWNRARAEAEVRAAYQNFRVKLRELGRHPSPTSPIIDELYVPGAFMDSVRDSQQRLRKRGLAAYPSKRTRWSVISVELPGHDSAVAYDCYVNGEVVRRGGVTVDDAVNTYEGAVSFVQLGGHWLVSNADVTRAQRGVKRCATHG